MKKYLFLFILSTYCSLLIGQQAKEDKKQKREAKIQTVVTTWYAYTIDGNKETQGEKDAYEKYDSRGNLTQRIQYAPKSGILFEWRYRYNALNQLIYALKKDSKGTIVEKYKVEYNANKTVHKHIGLLETNRYELTFYYKNKKLIKKEKRTVDDKKLVLQTVYKYTGENLIEESINSSKHYHTFYEYDDRNNKVKETLWIDSVQNKKIEYTYNSQGQLVAEKIIGPKERPVTKLVYAYNSSGKETSVTSYGYTLKQIKKKQNEIIKNTWEYREVFDKKWKYRYDEFGNIMSITVYDTGDGLPVAITEYYYKKYRP